MYGFWELEKQGPNMPVLAHTHTRTRMHARTHTRTHARTHTLGMKQVEFQDVSAELDCVVGMDLQAAPSALDPGLLMLAPDPRLVNT